MAFQEITENEIETGKPVSNTTQNKIRDSLNDLDQRITDLEGGGDVSYAPIIFAVHGKYGTLTTPRTDYMRTTINFASRISGVRIIQQTAGSSGTLEIDLQYKRGSGSWTSILTTKPSLTSAAGNDAVSTNAVLDEDEWNLESGDLLRLDITSKQGGTPIGFIVRVDFVKTA